MTTILFGAGASREFFEPDLSTQYLTCQVKDGANWDRVIDAYKKNKDANICIPKSQDVCQLINTICSIKPDYNFEQIGEIVDKFCSYAFDSMPNTYLATTLHTFSKMCNKDHFPESAEWGDVPFLYRQIIAEAIIELQSQGQVANYNNQINEQTKFIEYMMCSDDEINLISFNYDDLVLSSAQGLGFETGFVNKGIRGKILDVQTFFGAKKVTYFPHGHVRFKFTDQTNVEYFDSARTANNERWGGLSHSGIGATATMTPSKFAYNFNTFITTGQTKDDSLNFHPYAYFYQRMAKDLLYSERVVLIGYSFGDEHINRLLQSFIITDINHHVYIVDYYPNEVTMVNEWEDKDNIIFKINQTFGIPWLISKDPTTWKSFPHNPQQVQNINDPNLGYGDIFDRVHFYKKGYLDFLKNYKNFILSKQTN